MKRVVANCCFFCLAAAMFTSESVWYIPAGFLALSLVLMYLEARLRR